MKDEKPAMLQPPSEDSFAKLPLRTQMMWEDIMMQWLANGVQSGALSARTCFQIAKEREKYQRLLYPMTPIDKINAKQFFA